MRYLHVHPFMANGLMALFSTHPPMNAWRAYTKCMNGEYCGIERLNFMINWLLLFVPFAVGLEHLAPERHLLVFMTSGLAILPLAAWMGRATEHLAERMGEGVGGLPMRRSAMQPK